MGERPIRGTYIADRTGAVVRYHLAGRVVAFFVAAVEA